MSVVCVDSADTVSLENTRLWKVTIGTHHLKIRLWIICPSGKMAILSWDF